MAHSLEEIEVKIKDYLSRGLHVGAILLDGTVCIIVYASGNRFIDNRCNAYYFTDIKEIRNTIPSQVREDAVKECIKAIGNEACESMEIEMANGQKTILLDKTIVLQKLQALKGDKLMGMENAQ